MISLVSVYEQFAAKEILYDLLKERPDCANISHKAMPSWEDHVKFVDSKPYKLWYIVSSDEPVGSVYLTKLNEIGVFIFSKYQRRGYGTKAIQELMNKHKSTRLLANISPANGISISFFLKLGFKHIQNTYERRST